MRVNGKKQKISGTPGSYVALDREWRNGDRVEIQLPMKLHTEPLPGTTNMVAVLYGPIVLAGELGTNGMPQILTPGPDQICQGGRPASAGVGRRRRFLAETHQAGFRPAADLPHEESWPAGRRDAGSVLSSARTSVTRSIGSVVSPADWKRKRRNQTNGPGIGPAVGKQSDCRRMAVNRSGPR